MRDAKSVSPGPQYDIPSKVVQRLYNLQVVETTGYSMGMKYSKDPLNKTFDIPGPGTYNYSRKDGAPSFS